MGKSVMIKIQVLSKDGQTLAEVSKSKEVNLPFSHVYNEGDRIVFDMDEVPGYYVLQVDDALGEALVYVTGKVVYEIPFGEKKICYSPKIFSGESHLISARRAEKWEYEAYRNVALNVMDQHGKILCETDAEANRAAQDDTHCYPHALANVETRGESVFAAHNAIDGVTANHSHGFWPYSSWGINRDPNAKLRIDFGREITTDRVQVYVRADFPHDSWWIQAELSFSDGTKEVLSLKKTDEAQEFMFEPRQVRWIELGKLIKADDPSPFPALAQLKVFGK